MNALFKNQIPWILAGLLSITSFVSAQAQSLELTEAEQAWVAQHPVVRVHNEMDWPPFNFNVDGQPTGFSVEYMNLVAAAVVWRAGDSPVSRVAWEVQVTAGTGLRNGDACPSSPMRGAWGTSPGVSPTTSMTHTRAIA